MNACWSIVAAMVKQVKQITSSAPLMHSRAPARHLHIVAGALAVCVAATVMIGGCANKVDVPLPDLATHAPKADANKHILTSAEQKSAIDSMIAKRDSQEKDVQAAK